MTHEDNRRLLKTTELLKVQKYLRECARLLRRYPEYDTVRTHTETALTELLQECEE
jgi:hypothetical protein